MIIDTMIYYYLTTKLGAFSFSALEILIKQCSKFCNRITSKHYKFWYNKIIIIDMAKDL